VTLATDQAVTELLFAAKTNLKKTDPNSAAHKVYFNPDLSPQEAEKAYLRRQEWRLKNGGPNHVNSPLNSLVQCGTVLSSHSVMTLLLNLRLPMVTLSNS